MRSFSRFWPSKAPNDPSRHLTASEAAAVLGVTADSVRRWVGMGLLPAQRLGPSRRILIDPDDLERLFSSDPHGTAHTREPVSETDDEGDHPGADDGLVEAVQS